MNTTEFADFAEEFFGDMQKLLALKGADYTKGTHAPDDRLSNFRQVAAACGVNPLQCWLVYFMKHLTAVSAAARGHKEHSEPLRGRFLDLANYALLGAALAAEGD